jgi:hypothetical protein
LIVGSADTAIASATTHPITVQPRKRLRKRRKKVQEQSPEHDRKAYVPVLAIR